jgi:hypothetical protein
MMARSNGLILWEGRSLIDGAPLVCIAVGLASKSTNRKTGGMLQTYILRADVSPVEAVKTGADASICGECPHRGNGDGSGRTCYVNVGQGPGSVWRTYRAGKYPRAENRAAIFEAGRGRMVRLGTYGDPAAVPVHVWQALTHGATGWTGYTHQWRESIGAPLRGLCMASADSEQDAADAHAAGWRTFRVALPNAPERLAGEAICPASEEAGKKLTCATCGACNGANGRRGSIVIQAHGGFAVMANVKRKAEAAA